jgi:DNA ligase-1
MKTFAELYRALDETNKTNEKVEALVRYFALAAAADAAWAVYFLSGRKPRQVVPSRKLCMWAAEEAGIADWLFDESYEAVGDMAEAIALLLPAPAHASDRPLHQWVEDVLLPLRNAGEAEQREIMRRAWRELDGPQRYVWNKLITGGFRVGVSQLLLTRALGQAGGVDPKLVTHRLMGEWQPTPEFYARLLTQDGGEADASRPYPFFLAHPLDEALETLGAIHLWQAEWKWDGIRAQLIRRAGQSFLWSRGEELVTQRYPALAEVGARLPEGTVLDGEILPWKDGSPLPFAQLQRRIGRKALGKKILGEVPVVLMVYDLLEYNGQDIRPQELHWRRARLGELVARVQAADRLLLSPVIGAASWQDLAAARAESRLRKVEGLMLKRLSSVYGVGRQRGDWWKLKINPFTMDAVLIYAQPGHGKRASLYTDYTFGVWHGGRLVPIAKAYSGLTDEEIRQVDAFIRRHTTEKFGPVRTVKPELVFELAFEAIQRSSRHKSGVAVRFPRILRWRTDKKIEEAETLEAVQALLPDGG